MFRCTAIAEALAVRERQGSDRTPSRGASIREHGGTSGRILQPDHWENRDGNVELFSFFFIILHSESHI